jgi:hypothetical protein
MSDAFETASPEQRPHLLRSVTDPAAAAHFASQRHSADWQPCFDVCVPALETCALLMMVKDEADIIRQNLDHHYRLGFRRFFILDNASTDGTADHIEAFRAARPDAIVFCAYDPVTGYYQQTKMNALQVFAQSYLMHENRGLDWVFFVDADEFITCCSANMERARAAFQMALHDHHRKLLIFHWVQCASERPVVAVDQYLQLQTVFDRQWRALNPQVPKIAFRSNHTMMTTQGNHVPAIYPFVLDQAMVMAEAGFYLLHYPMWSIDQLRKKIVNGGRAYEAACGLDSGLGGHWKTYYRWFRKNGDAVLVHLLNEHIGSCA